MENTVVSLPLGEWRPDDRRLSPDHLVEAKNTIFQSGTYTPFPFVSRENERATAIDAARVHAAASITFSDSIDRTFLFAGNSVLLLGGANNVVDTIAGTLADQWISRYADFVVYGASGMAPKRYNPVTGTGPAAMGDAPSGATTAAQVLDNLFIAVAEKVYRSDSFRIQKWAGGSDPDDGTANVISLPRGGTVRALVGTQFCHAFCTDAIHYFYPVGNGLYNRAVLTAETGILGRHHSPVLVNNSTIFVISHDGVLMVSGNEVANIGTGRVNEWLLRRMDPLREHEVVGTHDHIRNLIFWIVPVHGGENILLVYNYLYDRFTWADVNAQHVVYARPPVVYTDSPQIRDRETDDIAAFTDDPQFAGGVPQLTVFYPDLPHDDGGVPAYTDGSVPAFADGSIPAWSEYVGVKYEYLPVGEFGTDGRTAYFETPAVSPGDLLAPPGGDMPSVAGLLSAITPLARAAHLETMYHRERAAAMSKGAPYEIAQVSPIMSRRADAPAGPYKIGVAETNHQAVRSPAGLMDNALQVDDLRDPEMNGWVRIERRGIHFSFGVQLASGWRHIEGLRVSLRGRGSAMGSTTP